MQITDNMDSNIAWYRVLMSSGQLFGSIHSNTPQIINRQLSRMHFTRSTMKLLNYFGSFL